VRLGKAFLALLLAAGLHAPVEAGDRPDGGSASADPGTASDPRYEQSILVTAERLRGSVLGDFPPVARLDEEDIRSYGASNIGALLDALEPRTRGNRGAAGTQPIVLLGGARISGLAEISGLPAEAVERIDILPEEVALAYGYPATSRVVNIVLKPRFRAATGEVERGFATAGGRSSLRGDLSLVSLGPRRRISLDLGYRRDTELLESERDLVAAVPARPFDLAGNVAAPPGAGEIDPALSALAGVAVTVAPVPASAASAPPPLAAFVPAANRPNITDLRPFRTLLPANRQYSAAAAVSGTPVGRISATLSGRIARTESDSRLGLDPIALLVPAGSPFSPFAGDVILYRYGEPLVRRVETDSRRLGLLLGGDLSLWRWTVGAGLDRFESNTRTTAGFDPGGLQARILAGDPVANPFAAFESPADLAEDRARYRSSNEWVETFANGPLFDLPAGRATASWRGRFEHLSFSSRSRGAGGGAVEGGFGRDVATMELNADLPIASRRSGTLAAIGDLSLSLNFVLRRFSDFGTLTTTGYALRASPAKRLTLTASIVHDQGAPGIEELGEPRIVTPNVPAYDFRTGETYDVDRLVGGNPALGRNSRHEEKIEAGWRPFDDRDLLLTANYTRVRLANPISTFPVATPAVEAALPARFLRDGDGRLVLIDQRPVNVANSRFEGVRWGASLATPRRNPDGRKLRLDLSAHHSWRLRNTILLARSGPELDLLAGDAIGNRGGLPRHSVDLQAGLFKGGIGARLDAGWQSASFVRGAAASGDLFFSATPRFDLRLFVNLGEQGGIAAKAPWLRAARLSVSVDNLFDTRPKVRDTFGAVPLAYQPAYLDPLGRLVRVSLRAALP
jgi:hypothetical protein